MKLIKRPPRRTYPGNEIRIRWALFDENSAPVTPSTVVFKVKPPNAPVESLSPTTISGNEYELAYTPTVGGLFYCRIETVSPTMADEMSFRIMPSNVV